MIVYGTKAVHLKSEKARNITCTNCDTMGSINMSVFSKHAHIFWIPMFPYGKQGESECSNCQQVLGKKAMPPQLRETYDRMATDQKGPIWQYVGALLAVGLISWGIYQSKVHDEMELEFLAAPQVGDVYEYKVESGFYSTFKLTEVTADSIYFSHNDYEVDKSTGLSKIDKAENYPDYIFSMSRQNLNDMYNDGEVVDIKR